MFLFAGIGYGLIPSFLINQLQSQFISLPEPHWNKHNTIILLTGGATVAIISESTAWSRIHTAARLYRTCKESLNECTILISGGDVGDKGIPLAENYQKALLATGIPQANIVVETKSLNTWQNAQFSCVILQKKSDEQVFLVTSAYHLKRALLYFSHFGIKAIPIPADFLNIEKSRLPTTNNIESQDTVMHEYFGLVQYYLYYFWRSQDCQTS